MGTTCCTNRDGKEGEALDVPKKTMAEKYSSAK